jgi:seryl-tRNA synthetase
MPDTISSRVGKWLINTLWPWVVKYLWPVIQKAIVQVFIVVVENYILRVFNYFKEKKINQAEDALTKAVEAEMKAKSAKETGNEIEAEKNQAAAKIWREVADNYKSEDKNLRDKLNSFAMEATKDFERQIDELKNDKTFDNTIKNRISQSPPPSLLSDSKE